MRIRHLTFKILLAYTVTLPAISLAALVGVEAPPVSAPQQSVVTPAGSPTSGEGTSKTDSGGGPPSQAGTVSAVSAILHPKGSRQEEAAAALYTYPEPMTKEDTQELILDESINNYLGPCACPYSRNSDGFECGVEAAYYKPGGFRIYCYPEDLRGQLYIFYRKTH